MHSGLVFVRLRSSRTPLPGLSSIHLTRERPPPLPEQLANMCSQRSQSNSNTHFTSAVLMSYGSCFLFQNTRPRRLCSMLHKQYNVQYMYTLAYNQYVHACRASTFTHQQPLACMSAWPNGPVRPKSIELLCLCIYTNLQHCVVYV